jgi:hypothetical protein
MMEGMDGIMWGIGLFRFVILVLIVVGIAALARYVVSTRRGSFRATGE